MVQNMWFLFSDVSKISQIRQLILGYRQIYNVFGSGCRHKPYSIFMEKSKNRNPTKRPIGLIRAAGTRMGGYWYCFNRYLHLHNALKDTVMCPRWEKEVTFYRKKELKQKVANIILNESYLKAVKAFVIILHLMIRCLWLANSNKPGMNKIWYYVW